MRKVNIEDLIDLPLMTNEYCSAIISIFTLIGPISYRSDTFLLSSIITEAIGIFLKYGNSADSPYLYATYGLILCAIGDIENGYRFGKLASNLVEKLNSKKQKPGVIFINNAFISHWKEHISDLLPLFKEGYECGLDVGNLEFAAYNGFYYCNKSFYAGKNLEELEIEALAFIESIKKLKQELPLYLTQMMCQMTHNLKTPTDNPVCLAGEIYDENIMLPLHIEAKDTTAFSSVYSIKLILCYLFEDYENGAINSDLAEKYIESLKSTVAVPFHCFYSSLNKLADFSNLSHIKQSAAIKQISANQKKMKKWSHYAPMNYLHKYYLVEAEKSRVFKKDLLAIEYYNKAIDAASKNNFIQDEALAYELLSKFYLSRENIKLARFYMEAAIYRYLLWGATSKVTYLENKYTFLLYSNHERENLKVTNNLDSTSAKDTSALLDTTTILKATQAISGEIILEELLKKLIYLLLENSGAQRVIFLNKQRDNFIISAEGSSEKNKLDVNLNLNFYTYDNIPRKVINFVLNSKEILILDNPSSNEGFMDDQYFLQNTPKSILCMPIISKMNLTRIIYLENNLIEGAFSKERIEILKLVSSQLSISIDNAKMYKDLELLNNSLEQKVQERTTELNNLLIKVYSLLDNSGEGFLTFDKEYIIDSEYSSECKVIFSKEISGINVLTLLFSDNKDIINSFTKTIDMITTSDDDYKKEMLISLLPSVINIGNRFIKVKYKVLENLNVMLILTDITHERQLEEKIIQEQGRLKFIVSTFTNKNDFLDLISSYKLFIESGYTEIVETDSANDKKLSEIYRSIHTFKGTFLQLNFINTPQDLHKFESELSKLIKNQDNINLISLLEQNDILSAFEKDIKIITEILGEGFINEESKIYIKKSQLIKLQESSQIINNLNKQLLNPLVSEATKIINTLHYKSIKEILSPYPDYTFSLSEKLGKSMYNFKIEGSNCLVDPNKYSSFLKSLLHVFRNAVDHGLETPDERIDTAKNQICSISCSIEQINNSITITIQDDGRGIDINKVREKAIDKKFFSKDVASTLSENELLELLFSDNFSTKKAVTEISGRGYGLDAVMCELKKINGNVKIETSLGKGTKFIFSFQVSEVLQ